MMKNYSLFLGVFLSIWGCGVDAEIKPFLPKVKPFLLTQQVDNQKLVKSIVYNTDLKIQTMTEFGRDIIRSEMVYINQRLVRQNDFYPDGSSAGYKVFFYDFYGRLDKLEHYKPHLYDYTQITLHHYETFAYNTQHQLTRSAYYHSHGTSNDMAIDSYSEYEYEPNGNLKTHRIYAHSLSNGQGDLILAVTGTFEFDTNPNPLPLNGRYVPDRYAVSPNNLRKATYRYPSGKLYETDSFEANYTYYEHGFPKNAVLIFADGTRIERSWEYEEGKK